MKHIKSGEDGKMKEDLDNRYRARSDVEDEVDHDIEDDNKPKQQSSTPSPNSIQTQQQ